jgi:hypothetical protein
MPVRSEPVSRLAPTFADNLCRWDRRSAPHYEVWFLTLNHRESQRGFWFRYTVEAPTGPPGAKPSGALWAAVFDRRSPERNFGIKSEYEIDRLSFAERDDFSVRIGDGCLALSNAVGRVTNASHTVEWDLNYIMYLEH